MIKVDGGGFAEVEVVVNPNKERLRLWVNALRSGYFKQTTSVLRGVIDFDEEQDENPKYGYCCLGVACMVAAANGCDFDLADAWSDLTDEILPLQVSQWFGFGDHLDDCYDPKLAQTLGSDDEPHWRHASHLNDEEGWTFEQIADAVEAKYNLNDAS